MQRAGFLSTTFHCAPRIQCFQSSYPRKRKNARDFLGVHTEGLSFSLDPLASSPDLPNSFCCSVVSCASTARVSARSAAAPS